MAQEVEVKLKVETSKAVSDVNKLGDAFDSTAKDAQDAQDVFSQTGKSLNMEPSINNLKALKRELKATTAGSKDFDKLSMSIRDMEDAIADAKKGNDDFLGQMENAPGILGMVGRGIRGAEAATNSFSGALKATGIGLIVALLGGLAAAFSNNEGAMKKLQPLLDGVGKIFQGVFRAVEPLFNTLVDLAVSALPMVSKAFGVVYSSVTAVFQSLGKIGSAIGKLISGDFSGAWQDAKSSVNDFGKNYDASVKRFTEGSKELTKTEKEEADKRAELRKASQEKQAAIDEKAKEERIAKAKAEAEALKKIEEERQALIGRQGEKAREEYEAAEKLIADAKKANENSLKTENQIKLEEENAAFEAKKLDLLNKGLSIEEIEKEHKRKLAQLDDEYYAIESEKAIERDRIAKEKKDQADKEKLESEMAIQNAIGSVVKNGNDLIGALQDAGIAKGKAGQVAMKALALVQIGLDTAQAFSTAVPMAIKAGKEAAAMAGPAAPFVGPIATATSYITSATMIGSNIMKAKKLLGGGGSAIPSSSANISGGSISTPTSMAPNVNVVGASRTNQIAETIAQQGQQPIKAYVVANDVTTQQGLNRSIVSSASIG
jgi:hypothetical protein